MGDEQRLNVTLITTGVHAQAFLFLAGNFEKESDDVTIKMVFAIVQIIGFSNSFCNPIVYAFMNENFRKNFVSAVCVCTAKATSSPAWRRGHSGVTVTQKKTVFCWRQNAVEEPRGEAFSDGNIQVRLCEHPEERRLE